MKEFGFRPVPEGPLPSGCALPPLQPVPVQAPGMVADPRLALSIGVCGSIAAEEACLTLVRVLIGLCAKHRHLLPAPMAALRSLLRAWPHAQRLRLRSSQHFAVLDDFNRTLAAWPEAVSAAYGACSLQEMLMIALPVCMQDFQRVWRALSGREAQRLALVWESQELAKLNSSILAFLKDQACMPSAFTLPLESKYHIGTGLFLLITHGHFPCPLFLVRKNLRISLLCMA